MNKNFLSSSVLDNDDCTKKIANFGTEMYQSVRTCKASLISKYLYLIDSRKANVSKAEVAIKREIQYKRMHGPEVKT